MTEQKPQGMSYKTIITVILGVGLLYALFTIGLPFLLALIVAIFLEPLNLLLIKYARMRRIGAVTITCTLFTLAFIGLLYLIGVKIISETITLMKKAPDYLMNADEFIRNTIDRTKLFYETLPEDTAAQLQTATESGLNALIQSLNAIVTGISGLFISMAKAIPEMFIMFIVFIVAVYLFSNGLNLLKQSFLSLFEETSQSKVNDVLINMRKAIFGFMRSQLLLSAVTYTITLFGLLILNTGYPLAIALLIVVVDILPILGTGSVLVPWAIYCFVSDDLFLGIGLLVLYIVITVVRRIIEPKILGDAIGISPLSALISLYIGFKLAGVVGIFLGPVVVMLFQAVRKVGLLHTKIKLE